MPLNNKPPLRCHFLGHKWKPTHRREIGRYGLPCWVYVDDVCQRCGRAEFRMPKQANL